MGGRDIPYDDEEMIAPYAQKSDDFSGTLAQIDDALVQINRVIQATIARQESVGETMGNDVYVMVDSNGRPMLADLLAGKAQLLAAKVALMTGRWGPG